LDSFLSSAFKIRSLFGFFLVCLAAFLLVISLEFLRRSQRYFDRYLRARNDFLGQKEYVMPVEEMEEKLLAKEGKAASGKERIAVVVLEQSARGLLHVLQFSVSYCIMLLFMYSNGMYSLTNALGKSEKLMICRVYYHFDSVWGFGWVCAFYEGYFVFEERWVSLVQETRRGVWLITLLVMEN
jgi:solute carrier family 31 (copper transporter), member 1